MDVKPDADNKTPMEAHYKERLPELDWLRVILIAGVFLHHVFMPFNGDDWHIVNADSSKVLDDIMVYFEQLRLPVLFFIAGAGSFILLNKLDTWRFLKNKALRLFVPFVVGVLFIVPPQNYFENIEQYSGFPSAYPHLALDLATNHLWFIEYLLIFMLLAIPVYALQRKSMDNTMLPKLGRSLSTPTGLFSLGLLLASLRVILKVFFPEQSNSIDNLSSSVFYFFFFLCGQLFISSPASWYAFRKARRASLFAFLCSSVLFYGYYFPDFSPYLSLETRWHIWWFLSALLTWTGLLVMMGYAQLFLQKRPRFIVRGSQLIYPFYILHQTVIVILAFYIVQLDWALWLKAICLLISSLALTLGICRFLIYPWAWARLLFGLGSNSKNSAKAN